MRKVCIDWKNQGCWNEHCPHKEIHEGEFSCELVCDFVENSHHCEKISKLRKEKLKNINEKS